MKYFTLIWAGLWRKPARTVLTLASVTVAFMLYGVLHSVTGSIDEIIDEMSDSRLRTMSRVNILEPLPIAHVPRIQNVDDVEQVSYYSVFFGYYQEPSNGLQVGALDIQRFLDVYPELEVTPAHREAMARTRTGALVGYELMEENGWEIGDRVPIVSRRWTKQDGSSEWQFDIVGTYGNVDESLPTNEMWVNYEYFDEERTEGKGTVNLMFEAIGDPNRAAAISEEIDALFRNSPAETQTQSEKEWLRAQINQIGDINFFVTAIIGAVLFTLLFLTGNTMMQSIRERIPELAVLKTYGFRDGAVIALVCAESLILCGLAAGIGLSLAASIFPSVFAAIDAPRLPMPWSVAATGFGIAIALALVSSIAPAYRVRRLSLVDALAGR